MAKKAILTDLEQIGLNIRKIREGKDISRAQLAFELNTTEKHITRIEYGEINSGIMTFINLARVLNVPVSDFFVKVKL